MQDSPSEATAAPDEAGVNWADRPLPTRRAQILCAVGALLATVIQIGPQWVLPPDPGPDQCYMTQAAVRLFRGQGLTSSMYDRLADLAEPDYEHLRHWPPMWCLITAGLMHLGFDADSSPVIIQTAAALLGAFGWMRLATRALPAAPAVVFCLGVASVWFGSILGPSDLPAWAIMPWFLGSLFTGGETGRLRGFAMAGCLAAWAVTFRYAAVFLIPAGFLAALSAGGAPLRRRLLSAAIVSGLPTLALAIVFAVNRSLGGSSSWVEEKGFAWSPENMLSLEPIKFVFAQGFGWDQALYKHRPSWVHSPWLVWPGWFAVMIAAAVLAARRGAAARPESARFLRLAGVVAFCLLSFLTGMTLFTGADEITCIGEPRYYRELMPAVGLAWLAVLWPAARGMQGLLGRLQLAVALLTAVLVWLHLYRSVKQDLRDIREEAVEAARPERELVATVRRLAADAAPHPQRIFDVQEGRAERYIRTDAIKANRFPTLSELDASANSRRTYVIVLDRAPHRPELDHNVNPAPTFVRRFGLRRVYQGWENGPCDVYAGWVEPYPAGGPPTR